MKLTIETADITQNNEEEVIFLAYLYHVCKQEWTHIGVEQLKLDLKLTPPRQIKLMNQLKRKGIIESKREGTPPKRYIKICKEKKK